MKHTHMISLPDHSLTDPHLLRGRDRINEIGRILSLGVRRLLAKQELEKQKALAADQSASARKK